MQLHPSHGVHSIKRHMGESGYTVNLRGKEYTPTDISAKLLQFIKEKASEVRQDVVEDVVITVPAWFQEAQRQETLKAAQMAGLNVLRMINEPTAAALAYRREESDELTNEKWLVYDLGGGTFDVSLLQVSGPVLEVLSTSGNSFLGGDDFDQNLLNVLVFHLKDEHKIDVSQDIVVMAKLRLMAESIKKSLSTETMVVIDDLILHKGISYSLSLKIDRLHFEKLISDAVDSTMKKVREVLEEAKCQAQQIDRLLLVGGSTRIPLIAERLKEEFSLQPELGIDPDIAVGLGAAVQAALIKGFDYSMSVIDICPIKNSSQNVTPFVSMSLW